MTRPLRVSSAPWELDLHHPPLCVPRVAVVTQGRRIGVERIEQIGGLPQVLERLFVRAGERPRALLVRDPSLASAVRSIFPEISDKVRVSKDLPALDRMTRQALAVPDDDTRPDPLAADAPRWMAAAHRLTAAAARSGSPRDILFFHSPNFALGMACAMYDPTLGLTVAPSLHDLAESTRQRVLFSVRQVDAPTPGGLALPNGKFLDVSMVEDGQPLPPTVEATRHLLALTQAATAWYELGGPEEVQTAAGPVTAVSSTFVSAPHEHALSTDPDGALRLTYTLARPAAERLAARVTRIDHAEVATVGDEQHLALHAGGLRLGRLQIPSPAPELVVEVRAPDAVLGSVRVPVR